MREAVILVHGVWSNGIDLWRLRQNLKRAGYECYIFNYHVWGKPPADLAADLNKLVAKIKSPVIHFVGHSFGGIVLLHLFDKFPFNKEGRVVLLACPVNGSQAGRKVARSRLTRWMLGKSIVNGLLGDAPEWKGWQDIGIIAGTFPLGAGLLTGGPDAPHDGSISVSETRLEGATDFITLPVSHSGILLSSSAATQVVTFLRSGKFGDTTVTPLPNY